MASNPSVSEVMDKSGAVADIEAKRFDGTRTFALNGDVSGSQAWNGDSSTPLTINVSIGAKKVTTEKINDGAVGTTQLADDSVTLSKIDDNAMTNTATAGDTRLITAGGVRNEIDSAILNRGKDYPPMTPTEINAISETIPTGSTVHVTASGTITDGNIEVRAGEDLRYFRGGDTHYWYSLDGEFKQKQNSKTVQGLSTSKTITSLTQDENGEINASASEIAISSSQVTDKMSTYDGTGADKTKVVTGEAVKAAIDTLDAEITSSDGTNVQVKVTEANGVVTAVNVTTDNTESRNNKVTSWGSTPSDSKYPSEKLVKDTIDAISTGSSAESEVVAEAINDIEARVSAAEAALSENNLGERTADSIDTQVLKIGGEEVAPGTATPEDVASSAAVGTSTNFAREDHKHRIVVGAGDSDGQVKVAGQNATVNGWSSVSSKANSAIQGVMVNGSALTPDSNKVVSIPTASDSRHGTAQFMSSVEAALLWAAAWAAASAT